MMCSRSLYGSNGWIGSGNVWPASEQFPETPVGIQVFGSKPWFCKKKIIRFGSLDVPVKEELASNGSGEPPRPKAVPAPAAMPWSIVRRLSIREFLWIGLKLCVEIS